jgi:hypothetical protein
MVTSLNTDKPAREAGYEMLQYVAGRIQAIAAGSSVNVKIGRLPAGAVITAIHTKVATAITGGTPVLSVGTSSGGTQIQGTIAEAAGSETLLPAAALVMPLTAETDVWVNITGGATAGDAYVIVLFAKPLA